MKEAEWELACRDAPANVNVNQIREQWLALSPAYDVNQWVLPLPVWRR